MNALDILKNNGVEVKEEQVIAEDNQDVVVPDEDDAVLLEKLKKRGYNLSSLEEINKPAQVKVLTPDEVEAHKKEKAIKARQYAIENKLAEPEVFKSYDADVAKGEALAYDLFKNELLEQIKDTDEEGTYTDEDLEEIWDNMNYQSEDDNSPKKKIRKKHIKQQVEQYLSNKYGNVLNIERDYDSFQEELNQAHQYKGVVEQAVTQVPKKFTFTIKGVPVEYEPTVESVQKAKDMFLDSKAYKTLGKNATVETISNAIKTVIMDHERDRLLEEVSHTYFSTRWEAEKKGRQGIVERDFNENGAAPLEETNPRAAQMLNDFAKK